MTCSCSLTSPPQHHHPASASASGHGCSALPIARPPWTLLAAPAPSLTLLAAAMDSLAAALPPLPLSADQPEGDASACASPCSVASDCSSVASADFDAFFADAALLSAAAGPPSLLFDDLPAGARTVFALDCVPLWGLLSVCGRRPEMEDAAAVVPRFFHLPLWMVAGDAAVDGLLPPPRPLLRRLRRPRRRPGRRLLPRQAPRCAGKGAAQSGGRRRLEHGGVLLQEAVGEGVRGLLLSCRRRGEWQRRGRITITPRGSGHRGLDGGGRRRLLVACHRCQLTSRAVLCRGKDPLPLSLDHKPNREDEYARIEALGGKVIQWNGYRVLGVLAMSRSIGDRYLKPYIIPVPEVTVVARARDDECLVLASDGLWDVLSNQEVCDAARKRILLWHKKNAASSSPAAARRSSGSSSDPAAQAAAEYLAKLALRKGSKDNITVVVVDLKAHRKLRTKT